MQCRLWTFLVINFTWIQLFVQAVDLESPSVSANLDHDVAIAVNQFGYKLLIKMMNDKKNENIVISPTGIAGLLAMTLLGSVGRTYDEIATALGFSQDILTNRKNHEQLGKLLQTLNKNNSSKTLYADAIFVDIMTPLRDVYRNYLQEIYSGEVLSTNFKSNEDARNEINDWVKSHTNGEIEDFLKRSLPSHTKLVLLSALYFRGQWEQPFVPEYTTKMPFKKPKEEVIADFMLNFGRFPYTISENHNFVMIGIPYNDSETIMYALKPRLPNKMSLLNLMEEIDYEKIDNTINEMTAKKCIVRFPKMELKSSVDLDNILKDIGIHDMFSPIDANFALMVNSNSIINKTEEEVIKRIKSNKGGREESRSVNSILNNLPNPGIHVDSVIHDVKMSINEYGTEAVAATAAVLARSVEQFYADSPFYFFIRNSRTKLVTFSAVIFDPTKQ